MAGQCRPPIQREIHRANGLDDKDAHCERKPRRVAHSTAADLLAQQLVGPAGRVSVCLTTDQGAGLHDWHGALEAELDGDGGRTPTATKASPRGHPPAS